VSRQANPIVVKELRSRMRGWRAFAVLTGVLLLLGAVSYLLYRLAIVAAGYGGFPLSPQIGQVLFIGLILAELLLISFITPAVTAGSISGEQEKLTYEMLLTTPLHPASILWGKLLASMSYILVLIFAAVPMASLVFIFGGVSPGDMVKALAILVSLAVTLGITGLFFSALLGRTTRAMVATYLAVLGLLVAPTFAWVLVGVLRQSQPPAWILIPNPVSALFSALTPVQSGGGAAEILWAVARLLGGYADPSSVFMTGVARPLYHYTLVLYGALSLALYLLTTRLVRPVRRWRIGRRALLSALAILLVFGGLVAAGFLITANRYEWAFQPTAMPVPVPLEASVRPAAPGALPAPTAPPIPTATPRAEGEPGAALEDDDLAAIYVAVIRQLYLVDHTFEEGHQFPAVYLLATTDDSVGDPKGPMSDGQPIAAAVQQAVTKALAADPGIAARLTWVESSGDVPLDANGTVQDGGAIFTLGNAHPQDDGRVLVPAGLYFGMLGAAGRTYVLEEVDGGWQVTGHTGVEWIS
jgi:ABC-type transport system involved in multi-copper enzyme maturation permease subunit